MGKRKGEKDFLKQNICVRDFFLTSFPPAAVHGFLISSETAECDELSLVPNPFTRASPVHPPHALMELHEFPLLLFNGDGYPNK